jgi:hypothetical protein
MRSKNPLSTKATAFLNKGRIEIKGKDFLLLYYEKQWFKQTHKRKRVEGDSPAVPWSQEDSSDWQGAKGTGQHLLLTCCGHRLKDGNLGVMKGSSGRNKA